MADIENLEKFYNSFHTLPKLVSDLALSIAEAQRRMDEDYVENLAEITKIIAQLNKDGLAPDQFLTLFRSIAPSRYQFTETTLEVRADLQMSRMSELGFKGELGIKAVVFAVTVNASYTRRSAYDYQASALIRTMLHAVPADPGIMDKLLERANSQTQLPTADRYKALAEAFKALLPPKQ